MPSPRALIPVFAALLIVLGIAGGYVYWSHRARVAYTARSLSAPSQPAKPQTRQLHIDGCHDDFTVKMGELVEPRVVPGAPLEEFRKIYGKETRRDKDGAVVWDPNPYTLTAVQKPAAIHLSLELGHVVQTLDGIELGIDSFGTVLRKMRDRGVETHERIERTPKGWTLIVSFYSNCSRNYRSEYSRTLQTTPELEKQIPPLPTKLDGQIEGPHLYRSDVFMNKVVSEYSLVPSEGKDDSDQGQPAARS